MTGNKGEHRVRTSRVSFAAVAALAAVGGLVFATTSASAQEVTRPPARVGVRPALPAGSIQIGRLAPAKTLLLDITLKGRNQAALQPFIDALSNRKSSLFHHYLTPAQFGDMFGASKAQVATVDAALRSVGLVPGSAGPNRLIIPVRTTAGAAERAFGTSLVTYRLAGGRVVYANSRAPRLPGAAVPYVRAVIGLDNIAQWHSQALRPSGPGKRAAISSASRFSAARASSPEATGPQACADAKDVAAEDDAFTATEFAEGYGFTPLYQLGDLGQGVRIALFELSGNATSNISTYKACYGLKTTVNYIKVDGGASNNDGEEEATLDIEDALGLAPDATIDVYQTPDVTNADYLAGFDAIFAADKDKVVSTSWGGCELLDSASLMSSEQSLFEEAAAQGQTVFAAAGDSGSTGCLREGADEDKLSPGDPAIQPDVVGVGGTTVTSSGQVVWNESTLQGGAGGGGLSGANEVWCMPSYQDPTTAKGAQEIPGVISGYSHKQTGCEGKKGFTDYLREEPDVSADADPYSGYVIYDNTGSDGGWTAIGGTSAAAPLWAAVAAVVDASPFCAQWDSGAAGVQPAGLYALAADAGDYIWTDGEILTDITKGNDDYTPSGYTGGLYVATSGYDMTTGLGTPVVSGYLNSTTASTFYPGLAAGMCLVYGKASKEADSITSVSPTSGAAGKSHKITITGKDFLTIAGSDMVYIETTKKLIAATCTSSTKCTATLPAHAAGTIKFQIVVEDVFGSNTKTFKYTS